MVFLAALSERYRVSYLEARREFAAEGHDPVAAASLGAAAERLSANLDLVVRDLRRQTGPANLPAG